MLNQETKRKIDSARDILVGKVPDPKAQVEQITTALIYKFMDDMDKEAEEIGGKPAFFVGEYEKYAWNKLLDPRLGGHERLNLYVEALIKMPQNPNLPELFRHILKDSFLPYRDPETLNLFLKEINGFSYEHSEKLGDAFEYLLSVLGSQGDAGQFRTPRHIIDFIVEVIDPKKEDTVLDPACGTAGFLISAYKHILKQNMAESMGDQLSPDERTKLMDHFVGYDISPDMVRLSLVNMYLHSFPNPSVFEYDTLTSEERWEETYDVIMANPPFMTPKGGIRPHKRFSIQANRSEVLFVDYIAEHLNTHGRAGVIVPEGIIFQSGNAYKALRKTLTEKYLFAVVSLPAGVFNPYSGVKTSILLMDKQLSKSAENILFVKVENDGFDLGANKRPIDKNDLPKALNAIKQWKIRNTIEGFQDALLLEDGGNLLTESGDKLLLEQQNIMTVEKKKIIESGDYNLSGERYKETKIRINQKWPMVDLRVVTQIISGQSPEGAYYNEESKGLPFYQGKADFGELYIKEPTKWTTQVTKEAMRNDVLMSVRAPVGPVNLAPFTLCIGRGLAAIRSNTEKLNHLYLFYLLRSAQEEIKKYANGSTFESINRDQIGSIKIPLPPLEVQQEIVGELVNYQNIIDGAKQVVESYKPTFKISSGWKLTKLENAIEFLSGLTLSIPDNENANGIPIISMNSITRDGEITIKGIRKIRLPKKNNIQFLQKGDLLFNWRNGSKDLVGKTGYFNFDGDYVFASFLLGIRPNKDILDSRYLWILLNNYRKEGKYMQFMRQNINGLFNREELKDVEIPLPPIEVQGQIVSQIEGELKLVDANKKLIEIFEQKIKAKIAEVWSEPSDKSLTVALQEEIPYAA